MNRNRCKSLKNDFFSDLLRRHFLMLLLRSFLEFLLSLLRREREIAITILARALRFACASGSARDRIARVLVITNSSLGVPL